MSKLQVFEKYPNLLMAMSLKEDGPMGLAYQVLELDSVQQQRNKFLQKFGIGIEDLVTAGLVHEDNVEIVGGYNRGKVIASTDALITQDKNVFLAITAADCMPIFFYDPKNKVISLAHVGWRSLVQNIIAKVIDSMKTNFKSDPVDILAYVGPSIGLCHFEVKDDVVKYFSKNKEAIVKKPDGKIYIDLWSVAKNHLQLKGISEENIKITKECTYCNTDKYFSARRDQSKELDTMLVVFGIN